MKSFNSSVKTTSIGTLEKHDYASSTRALLIRIWNHLSRERKIQSVILLITMLSSGVAELISLGAVVPFLVVLSNPERIWDQPLLKPFLAVLGYTQKEQFLPLVTLIFILATVLAALVRLFNLWLNLRMAAAVGSDLSCEAYQLTLCQPYEVHIRQNSSAVITNIVSQTGTTVAGLNAFLQVVTSIIVATGLFIGLILIDAQIALGAAALFGFAYGILVILARQKLQRNGEKVAVALEQQMKALQEGLGAIRDVLLDGNQETYVHIYREADRFQRKLSAKNKFLGAFPRFALEALGIIGIALIGFLLLSQKGSEVAVIPLLGGMALGAQRLLPALQQIYSGWAALKSYNAAIEAVLSMLDQPKQHKAANLVPMQLIGNIDFNNVFFGYGGDNLEVLKGVNFEIQRGERIGLIGTTGSGKSTTVDLLMGLLKPVSGKILVNGQDLHDIRHPDRLRMWQSSIAHVPQNIYLADSSIAENIAFGLPIQKIDFARVQQAAEQAQISRFIEDSPQGYQSFVGERGIRLSGGQRQRIGIARALYKQATFLVFDEATSALDSNTEDAVMEAVDGLSKDLTIVMIAHRLTTVTRCDRVIRLTQGVVSACGPPSQVLTETH